MADLRLLPAQIYRAFPWHLLAELPRGGHPDVSLFKTALRQTNEAMEEAFRAGEDASRLVHGRATVMDYLLKRAWEAHTLDQDDALALIAVGGYGRGELHPYSDIDLLILTAQSGRDRVEGRIAEFITFLWDLGLKLGHSVRTVEDSLAMARSDVTVATTLMESRLLIGSAELYCRLSETMRSEQVWPVQEFFTAKLKEQKDRHHRFGDTAYRLEPNVKEGPGGLRDIQMVGWIAKRHLGAVRLCELVDHGFLTPDEYAELVEGQDFLWRVRLALHILVGRAEDRLLFDYQISVAELFGYSDQDHNLAVEQFMQRYYRTVMGLERLNEMLLQHYKEAILYGDEDPEATPINRRFQVRRGFLEATGDQVFEQTPSALLEVFLILQQHPEIEGIRASTIRLIRKHRNLIDERFRDDLRNRTLFMEILRQPEGITREFRRMSRYGILERYWPSFGRIVGRMQYDLFHIYTVDEHILLVLHNIRRMLAHKYAKEMPYCSKIVREIPKLEILYLAALFHDIAKGRKGDHSQLGAQEAEVFCLRHGLSQYDANLVAWLVCNHLLMSLTAQRQDLSDPEVITRFATQVGNMQRLNHLYLLTIADIRGTNPALWNSWRHALLLELYHATHRTLRRGLENPLQQKDVVRQIRAAAAELLFQAGVDRPALDRLWADLPDEYFLRHTAEEVAWHSREILALPDRDTPLLAIRPISARGSTEIFIYAPVQNFLFARVTAAFSRLGLNVVSARIMATHDGRTLDTFFVLDSNNEPVSDAHRIEEIRATLCQALQEPELPRSDSGRRQSRQVRHFNIPTEIHFDNRMTPGKTFMELVTSDHPGLLAEIGKAFREQRVAVSNARIATLGARVEDLFYIGELDGTPIEDPERLEGIRQTIATHLQALTS